MLTKFFKKEVQDSEIYLDNAATTKVLPEVVRDIEKYLSQSYGNPSSQHPKGLVAKQALEDSRSVLAKSIGAKPEEIVFTSGGTESNNLTLKGLFYAYPKKKHIITTAIEHDCVLNACRFLETLGAEVTYLPVDQNGFISLTELSKAIRKDTLLVSVIHANNEIGVIQDIRAIGKICREKKVFFHTDACQSFAKVPLNVQNDFLDLVTLNAHKIHGPKGVGALYIREGISITPLQHGGGQERGIRSGTENVPGIVGFQTAVRFALQTDQKRIRELRDRLISGILQIPNTSLNGSREQRLSNNVNICFHDVEGDAIGGMLADQNIFVSTGSACLSNTHAESHVLKALGKTKHEIKSSLRLSLSKFTTEAQIDATIKALAEIVPRLRKVARLS